VETEYKVHKKRKGPAEKKSRNRLLRESVIPAPDSLWQKAISKNADEREDGRNGLSLLFLLFEDTLELKADHDGDPLSDLDNLLAVELAPTVEECFKPKWGKMADKVSI